MIARSFRFLGMSIRSRCLVAIAASLMLHIAFFTLLSSFIFADGVFNMGTSQTYSGLTVNLIQSTGAAFLPTQRPVLKSSEGDTFHQPTKVEKSSAAIVFSSGYLPVRELDVIPVIRRDINLYPDAMSTLQGSGGKIIIGLWIDEFGHVVKSELLESDMPEIYGEAATHAFLQADFQPGKKNGSAVKSKVKVVMIYSSQPQDR